MQAKVSLANKTEFEKIVNSARKAQPAWAATNPQRRARVLMKFVELLHRDMDKLAEKLWNNLPDLLSESNENILPMIDVSGSMFGQPLAVATSLGMYLAERTKGEFRDMFLTFSENPELVKLQGDTVGERLRRISNADWGMSTDFTKAYQHKLDVAVHHDVVPETMPTK